MWKKVFRSRGGGTNKWEPVVRSPHPQAPAEENEVDDDSTVGSVNSILYLPPVPPPMSEPTKAGASRMRCSRQQGGVSKTPPPGKSAFEQSRSVDRRSPSTRSQSSVRMSRGSGTSQSRTGELPKLSLADFQLIKTVGTGSFGRVFLAKPIPGHECRVRSTDTPARDRAMTADAVHGSHGHSRRAPASSSTTQCGQAQSSNVTLLAPHTGGATVSFSAGSAAGEQMNREGSPPGSCSSIALPLKHSASAGAIKTCNYVAIKRLNKSTVLEMKQINHVQSEKEILEMIDHPFLVRMIGTFHDPCYLYIAMEFVEGGEFFSFLRKSKRLSDAHSKFYAAHIVLIFEYLHERCVVYRDLKPENLLLTKQGFLKLTDFGFAKYLINRTYTLCGTPEYIAPEVLLNKGHGFPVDWWALGVLIYEMIVGYPPFYDQDALCIYKKILDGRIIFPRFFPKDAKSLVKHLLCHDLVKRVGHLRDGESDVRYHRWFNDIDFNDLMELKICPPYVPKETDTAFKYFGEYAEDTTQPTPPPYDPFVDW